MKLFVSKDVYQNRIAIALGIALAVAPLCLGLRIDWDRCLPLLLLPALWMLRRPVSSAGSDVGQPPIGSHPWLTTGHNTVEKWLLLSAALCCGASALFAVHPARAAALTAAWVLIVGGGIAATRLATSATAIRIVLAGGTVGGLVSLVAVRLRISPENGIPLFAHPRLLGLYMLIALLCALGLAFTLSKEHRRAAALLYTVAAFLCGGMIWSGGRSPLVGLAAGMIVWFILLPKPQRLAFTGRLFAVLVPGFLVSITLGHPIPEIGWDSAFGRTLNSGSLVELSSNRSAIWAVSLKEFTHAMCLGHGADFYLYQTPRVSGATGSHPHNFIVQWLLDFGILGTVALLGLLGSRLVRGLRKEASPLNVVATVGLVTCAAAALLDGGFYHAVIFMPAAIFAGLCYSPTNDSKPAKLLIILGAGATGLATAILLLNGWLFYQLKYAIPASPKSPAAVALRHFPSNVHGLWTWLDAWKKNDPEAVIDWGTWAQSEAVQPEFFGIYTARQYLEIKDFVRAEVELKKILTYVVPEQQKAILGMINEVRRRRALFEKTAVH